MLKAVKVEVAEVSPPRKAIKIVSSALYKSFFGCLVFETCAIAELIDNIPNKSMIQNLLKGENLFLKIIRFSLQLV